MDGKEIEKRNEIAPGEPAKQSVTAQEAVETPIAQEAAKQSVTAQEAVETPIAQEAAKQSVTAQEAAKPLSAREARQQEELAANEALCDELLLEERYHYTYMLRFRDICRHRLQYSLFDPVQGSVFWLCLILASCYLIFAWSDLSAQNRAIVIVLMVLMIWYIPVRAVVNSARNALYLKQHATPTEYHVCEKGLVVAMDGLRRATPYQSMRKLKVYRNWCYAQVYLNSGFLFPKDLVGDSYEELKAFLKARVGKK